MVISVEGGIDEFKWALMSLGKTRFILFSERRDGLNNMIEVSKKKNAQFQTV